MGQKNEVIPVPVLQALRDVGDPDMKAVLENPENFVKAARTDGLLRDDTKLTAKALKLTLKMEGDPLDVDKLQHAQRLFATYGPEIAGALLLAALPQTYAARWGSRVLVATTQLHRNFRARILGTAQFLVAVMQGAQEDVEKLWIVKTEEDARDRSMMTPWKACLAVRCYHQAIRLDFNARRAANGGRYRTAQDLGEPINQEDLLATLLTFTITVFEVLERYGITWTADDQQAYLYAWDLIGKHLGIGYKKVTDKLDTAFQQRIHDEGWQGLRPATVTETRRLADQLRERQWPSVTATPLRIANGDEQEGKEDKQEGEEPNQEGEEDKWEGTRAGRILVRALIEELARAMPHRRRSQPLFVMRALAPEKVRDRLNLGGGGIVLASLDLLPRRRALIDWFTAQPITNPIGGRLLRLMANDVMTHVMVNFTRTGGLRLPGLEDWSPGLDEPLG